MEGLKELVHQYTVEVYEQGYKAGKEEANKEIVPTIKQIHDGVFQEGQQEAIKGIKKIMRMLEICDRCDCKIMDCCDCEIYKIEEYLKEIDGKNKPKKKCKDCVYLDTTDKSTVGYACTRPNHHWRTSVAHRKYKHTPACKDYKEKE